MGEFVVDKITDIARFKLGDTIPESDYVIHDQQNNKFIQFAYRDVASSAYPVGPGVFGVGLEGNRELCLLPTGFNEDPYLEEYLVTGEIVSKVRAFFQRTDTLKSRRRSNKEPTRGFLLIGPPGCGKTATIAHICREYTAQNDTLVVIWHTDKFQAYDIKAFLQRFDYDPAIKRIILIIEDIGG